MKQFNHMRKPIMAGMLFLLPLLLSAQSLRIGRGTNLVMQGNATLVLNDAALVNDGDINAGSSTVVFAGETAKATASISGTGKTAFNNLLINRPFSQVQLDNNISISGQLIMSAGNLELNNHRLDLGSTGAIIGEHINSRITGTKGGSVMATAVLNAPSRANPGNIGVELSSQSNLGPTVITRGHVQQVNARGQQGINRYYDIQPAFNANDVALRFFYLEPELADNNEAELVLWSGDNASWNVVGKENSDANTNWLAKNNIGKLSRFTLGVAEKSELTSRIIKGNGLAGISSLQAYPNPARDRFTVALYSDADRKGSVSLQDVQGRVLERRQIQYIKGMNSMQWDIAKYASGTYYLVFENTGLGNLKVVKQ